VPISSEYWLLAIGEACVFTIATLGAFSRIQNLWAATAAAAGIATLVGLPVYSLLSTFAWSDLFYREQFQQFVLLPFVTGLVFLICLVLAVPRVHPLPLAL